MSIWTALDAGTRGFQGGLDFTQQAVGRGNALRDQRDQRTMKDTLNEVGPLPSQQPRIATQPGAATTTVGGEPPPAPAQAPAPPPAAPVEAAPVAPAATGGEDLVSRALQGFRSLFVSQGATGEERANPEAIRRVATGQSLTPGDNVVRGARSVSGNVEAPLSRQDLNSYFERAQAMFSQRGISHLYDEWQAKTMQSLQSSAYRSLVFASVALEAGNTQAAAQLVQRAYGYIPDGAGGDVQVGPDGSLVATRRGADGQPIGQPLPLNAQKLREMAVSLADPKAMEALLLDRAKLAETSRHNRAQEGLYAQRTSATAAAASARAGRGAGETSLSIADRNKMMGEFDQQFDEKEYTTEAEARPGWFGATGPDRLTYRQAHHIGQSLIEHGTYPGEATRLARAIGLRAAKPVIDNQNGGQIVGVSLDGAFTPLPASTLSLITHYNRSSEKPTGVPAAPTHTGPRAIRQQEAPR